MSTTVKLITDDKVELDHNGNKIVIKNDSIIVCAGGILPTPLLKQLGITINTKFGTL